MLLSQDQSPLSKGLIRYGIPAIVALFYGTAAFHFAYTPDDTYIYLRYARNIADGSGFSFNPGEATYGITGPLWVLLLSLGGLLHLNLFIAAKILDLALASGAIVLFVFFALDVLEDHVAAVVAGFAFSVNVWVLRWTATGMESSLALLLVIAAARAAVRNDRLLAVVLAALLTLVRPEGTLFFVLLLINFFVNSPKKARAVEHTLVSIAVYAALLAPWVIYANREFGTFVPATASAKSALVDFWGSRWWALIQQAKILFTSDLPDILLLLLGIVLVATAKRWADFKPHLFALLWIASLPATYIAFGVDVVSRYLVLVIPFLIIYGFRGFLEFQSRWRALDRLGFTGVILFAGLLLVENQVVYHRTVVPHMREFTAGMKETLIPLARQLSNETPHGSVVLVPDAGAIGYYSNRTVYDVAGLVTPEMLRLRKQGLTCDEIMTKGLYREVVQPDYVVDRSDHPNRLKSDVLTPMYSGSFPGLGINDRAVQFYTLYKVQK